MRFTWNEEKRLRNLGVHGLDFREAHRVFAGWTYTLEDDRFRYDEERFLTLGLLFGRPVAIVHTETEQVIHVSSFRKATRHETEVLFDTLGQ